MLTQIENRFLIWFYTVSCKLWAFPLTWKNNKMILKSYDIRVQMWKWITWPLLLVTLISQFLQSPISVKKKDMDQIIVDGALLIVHLTNAMIKLNVGLYKSEMAHIITHVFRSNSSWGMSYVIHLR